MILAPLNLEAMIAREQLALGMAQTKPVQNSTMKVEPGVFQQKKKRQIGELIQLATAMLVYPCVTVGLLTIHQAVAQLMEPQEPSGLQAQPEAKCTRIRLERTSIPLKHPRKTTSFQPVV